MIGERAKRMMELGAFEAAKLDARMAAMHSKASPQTETLRCAEPADEQAVVRDLQPPSADPARSSVIQQGMPANYGPAFDDNAPAAARKAPSLGPLPGVIMERELASEVESDPDSDDPSVPSLLKASDRPAIETWATRLTDSRRSANIAEQKALFTKLGLDQPLKPKPTRKPRGQREEALPTAAAFRPRRAQPPPPPTASEPTTVTPPMGAPMAPAVLKPLGCPTGWTSRVSMSKEPGRAYFTSPGGSRMQLAEATTLNTSASVTRYVCTSEGISDCLYLVVACSLQHVACSW